MDSPTLLRSHGLRVTAQRSTLLRLLCEVQGHQHLTAKELFIKAEPALPGLNLATVYRTLEGLHEAGLVDRLDTGHEQVHYSFRDPEHRHGHLACKQCGAVEEFDYQTVVAFSERILREHGFRVDRDHLTLSGRCQNCLEEETEI